jgi:tyrosine-protein kinase Etk/Wzc
METRELTNEETEINMVEFLFFLVRQKRLIVGGTFAFALLTLTLCFIVSPIFTGTTTVLPPPSSGASAATQLIGSMAGGAAGMLLGASLPPSSGDLLVGLLADNAVLDPIIDRFDLMKVYDLKTRVATRQMLTDKILKAEKGSTSGIVSISVDDKDAQRAADMANAFAEQLKKVLETLAVTEAGMRRIFFDRELKKAFDDLGRAEAAMQGFQESTGAIKVEDQAMAILQGVAAIKSTIVAKEVQLQVMKTYASANNPDLRRAEQELHALKEQMRRQEEKHDNTFFDPLMSTGQLPSVGAEYVRKMRDFKYRETVYELIAKQYEVARLDEAREAVVVQVIQTAIPPDKNTKPNVILLVALSIVLGGVLFTLVALGKESFRKASERPENEQRVQELKNSLIRL